MHFNMHLCFVICQDSMRVILEGSLGPDGRHKFHQFHILPQVAFVTHSSVTLHFLPLKIMICFPVLLNLVISALSGTLGRVMQRKILNLYFCNPFCLGRTHIIHAPSSLNTYTASFKVVHSDHWDSFPQPLFMLLLLLHKFVNTFTKLTWIYFLMCK